MTNESNVTPTPPPRLQSEDGKGNQPNHHLLQASQLAEELLGPIRQELNPTGFLTQYQTWHQAHQQALELVTEPDQEWELENLDEEATGNDLTGWQPHPEMDLDGMPLDKMHPIWAMMDDETVSTQEVLQALQEWKATLT